MGIIRSVRHQLHNLDRFLSNHDVAAELAPAEAPRRLYDEIKAFLRSVDVPNEDARTYREIHIERIARTLSMVPPPGKTKRVLELGAYMQMTPLLECTGNPQLFSMYPNPHGEYKDTEIPHVREYTPQELGEAVQAAGFEIQYLFTEKIAGYNSDLFIRAVLERNGYSTALRGEQTYLIARKRAGAEIKRYPAF